MKFQQRYGLLLLLPFFFLVTNAQPKRGLQPEDLYQYKEVADANISPDGSRVAYTVTEVSADRTRNVTHIWLVSTNGGEPKRLTTDEADEITPRWSPDGKWLAYYKQDGLWIANPDSGAAQLVTRLARTNFFFNKASESFTWAPDSKRIAFLSDPSILPKQMPSVMERLTRPLTMEEIMQLPPATREMILKAQGKSAEDIKRLEAAAQVPATDVRVITRLQYKSRTAFSDHLQSHIFIADITTKQVRQLTSGSYAEHSIHWSPKGEEIVFVSNHEPDPDKVNNSDLFVVTVTTGDVRQLTRTKGCEWQPVFSPDGNQIAYLATTRDVTTIDSVAEDAHVWVIEPNGKTNGQAIKHGENRVYSVKWIKPEQLSFTFGHEGKIRLKQLELFHGQDVATTFFYGKANADDGSISGFSLSTQSRLAFTHNDPTNPTELFILKEQSGNDIASLRRLNLSNANSELLSKLQLSTMRDYKFANEGFEIQGWVVPPLNLDEKKKYPLILYIHGGPHGMHGYSFNATVQALAAKGYGVLLINPRGSSGYGQKFADGCVNDWGGGDYRDLMRGVDVALEKFPYLDKDRMGVMGGSYGGYMTNWIVTQTDRFKAAIASASLSNLISFYSTSLYQDLIHAEFAGFPWDNYDKLWERSPLKHIKNVKTPTMLVHGEADNDVHITQAEEMFTALKMRGVDTVLVRYPREGHGIREPQHRVDNLQRVLDWFEKYLR